MNEHQPDHSESTFGEKLLGMEGFSRARAERYRAEISKLLTHGISRFERWAIGCFGVIFLVLLLYVGISIARQRRGFEGLAEARWTLAGACVATGAILGGWMLRVAIKGGYGRRAGDLIGITITTIFCVGAGSTFVEVAWATENPVMRAKMLFAGEVLFAFAVGCLLLTLLQRMHRQTQEKLLRIDYHLAELMERSTDPSSK